MLLRNRFAFPDRNRDLPAPVELPPHVLGDGPDELLRREDDLVLAGPLLDLLGVLLEGLHLVLVEAVDSEGLRLVALVHVAQDGDLLTVSGGGEDLLAGWGRARCRARWSP